MRIQRLAGLLCHLLVIGSSAGQESVGDLSALLENKLEGSHLPALVAAVIVDGELRAEGAAGVRKKGEKTAVTVDDKFHIGSCTKSMTATLAAALVEDGVIAWDTTVGEVLDDLPMKESYREATLRQLLAHTAGFPTEVPTAIWLIARRLKGKLPAQRRAFAKMMLDQKPRYEPGEGWEYSNTGYAVAGVMLERVAGKSWEDLMQERLFEPLAMKSAGFREPASEGKVDQPWGHHSSTKPEPPGRKADNPNAIAPAGLVHCSIEDLARYARLHALKETGIVLKKADSFEALHSVVAEKEGYALGWIVVDRGWAKGKALTHGGSNGMWATVMWLAPERDFAVVVSSNIAMSVAAKPMDEIAAALIEKYLD